MSELTDPALIHWMDEHRRHALALMHRLIGLLYELRDHDRHAMDRVAADRVAIGHAAAEIATHLESVELHGTAMWLGYIGLSTGVPEQVARWRQAYAARGADGLRADAVQSLEEIAASLEHPVAASMPAHTATSLLDGLSWLPPEQAAFVGLLRDARVCVDHLAEHPHDPAALEAMRQAWARFAAAGLELAERVTGTVWDYEHLKVSAAQDWIPNGMTETRDIYAEVHKALAAPETEQAVQHGSAHVLHDVLHLLTQYLNFAGATDL